MLMATAFLAGCGYEPCPPYNLDACNYELAKAVPLMEDHFFCNCSHKEATDKLPIDTDRASFSHYSVSGFDDYMAIVRHYQDFFKAQGYADASDLGPKNMYTSYMDLDKHFDTEAMEELFDDGHLGHYHLYFYKGQEIIHLDIEYLDYKSLCYATISNEATIDLFPTDTDARVESVKGLGKAYSRTLAQAAEVAPVSRTLAGSDTVQVLYVNAASENFPKLVNQTIPEKKFHFQYDQYTLGNSMRQLGEVNAEDFKFFTDMVREVGFLAVYRREEMEQPVKTGSGHDPWTNQPVDYYLDGHEKGSLYLVDVTDWELVKIEKIEVKGIYDFKDGEHYESDFYGDEGCFKKLAETLKGYPGVKVKNWGKDFYYRFP